MQPLSSLTPVESVEPLRSLSTETQPASRDFSALLESAIQRVESSGGEASQLMDKFMAGDSVDLHTVALAGQKASLQFEMLLQVRNKVVQAYQEVMRLQL